MSSNQPNNDKDQIQQPTEEKPENPKLALESLEEDDEFEDFPAEDWEDTESELGAGSSTHFWEENWDDDADDNFSAQLKAELAKTQANKPNELK